MHKSAHKEPQKKGAVTRGVTKTLKEAERRRDKETPGKSKIRTDPEPGFISRAIQNKRSK